MHTYIYFWIIIVILLKEKKQSSHCFSEYQQIIKTNIDPLSLRDRKVLSDIILSSKLINFKREYGIHNLKVEW